MMVLWETFAAPIVDFLVLKLKTTIFCVQCCQLIYTTLIVDLRSSNLWRSLFQAIFYMAISRYIEQPEKIELLLHLLKWMPGQGYHVDLSARKLILENSHLFEIRAMSELLYKHSMVLKANKSREGKSK